MDLLNLKDSLNRPAKANEMHWYSHILRRDNGDGLRRALDFEMDGRRKRVRHETSWKRQVDKPVEEIGLKKDDAIDRPKWHNAVTFKDREVNTNTSVKRD